MLLLIVGAVSPCGIFPCLPLALSPQPQPSSLASALPLPDKPSIAVLPFVNMSGDPQQEYFSDGITEDLITDLSKLSGLFVIARNSAFTYKGKAVKVQEVSKELGVRYVLEGSVRKADERVRITAQLIDATTGHHLWAERYDRALKDIFALQDEIVQKIVATLRVQSYRRQSKRGCGAFPRTTEAYDYHLARGGRLLAASRKRPMPRRGSCLSTPLSWTRSMRRRTRAWAGPTTRSGSGAGVRTPRPWNEPLNWRKRPSPWMTPCLKPTGSWVMSMR